MFSLGAPSPSASPPWRCFAAQGWPSGPAFPRVAHSWLGSQPAGPPRAVLPAHPPIPLSPRGSVVPPTTWAVHPGPARRQARCAWAPPHLRVRTVGLYLPLLLFLKSEFMVALGVGGWDVGSRRRSGHWAAEAPARTKGRAASTGERAAALEPRVLRGCGARSLLAGGGALAGHWLSQPLPRRWCLPSRRRGTRRAGLPGSCGAGPDRVGRPLWSGGGDTGSCQDTAHRPARTFEMLGRWAGAHWPLSRACSVSPSPPRSGPGAPLNEGPIWLSAAPLGHQRFLLVG